MPSDIYIVEIAVDDGDDYADDEEHGEMTTTAETRNMLCLLLINGECSGGEQQLICYALGARERLSGTRCERKTRTSHPRNTLLFRKKEFLKALIYFNILIA